jgi:hypothetical protein
VDKGRSNFCEYFVCKGSAQENVDRAHDAKEALDALFKK